MQSWLAQARRRPEAPPRPARRPGAPAWACAALVALSLTAGCAPRATHVERGERYRAGAPRFDSYFADVHASRRDVAAAAERRRRARARLARSLGLDPDAGEASVARALRERSERWQKKGARVRVDASGATAPGAGDGDAVVQNLSACARSEAETAEWSGHARRRADDLRARGAELERHVDDLPSARRAESRRELRAADHDLRRQADRARSLGRESEHFLSSLQEAAHGPPRRHHAPHGKPHPKPPAHHDGPKHQPPAHHDGPKHQPPAHHDGPKHQPPAHHDHAPNQAPPPPPRDDFDP